MRQWATLIAVPLSFHAWYAFKLIQSTNFVLLGFLSSVGSGECRIQTYSCISLVWFLMNLFVSLVSACCWQCNSVVFVSPGHPRLARCSVILQHTANRRHDSNFMLIITTPSWMQLSPRERHAANVLQWRKHRFIRFLYARTRAEKHISFVLWPVKWMWRRLVCLFYWLETFFAWTENSRSLEAR